MDLVDWYAWILQDNPKLYTNLAHQKHLLNKVPFDCKIVDEEDNEN